jgi:hypothetical protein
VNNIFASYYSAITLKWIFTGVCIGLAVLSLSFGGFLLFKVNRLAKAVQAASDNERHMLN